MSSADYSLGIVVEGLQVICMSPKERNAHYHKSGSVVDDNFDSIVLDSLPGAVIAGLISKDTAERIKSLYEEADKSLENMNWQQEDVFLAGNSVTVKEWQDRASKYLAEITAHNKNSNKSDGYAAD